MTIRNSPGVGLIWVGIFALIALWLVTLLGCSHTDCNSPEETARAHGVVLECTRTQKNGRSYRSCLVLKPGGKTVNLVYRSCPVQ